MGGMVGDSLRLFSCGNAISIYSVHGLAADINIFKVIALLNFLRTVKAMQLCSVFVGLCNFMR